MSLLVTAMSPVHLLKYDYLYGFCVCKLCDDCGLFRTAALTMCVCVCVYILSTFPSKEKYNMFPALRITMTGIFFEPFLSSDPFGVKSPKRSLCFRLRYFSKTSPTSIIVKAVLTSQLVVRQKSIKQ